MRLLLAIVAVALYNIVSVFAADSPEVITCSAVTTTVTIYPDERSSAAVPVDPTTTIPTTITSTSTNYVTVFPSTSVVPSSSSYYYVGSDGSTSWVGGNSPGSSYSSYVTKTIEITVYPALTSSTELTIIQTKTVTITPSVSTSLVFIASSSASPHTSTSTSTVTSTETFYMTETVSFASSTSISAGMLPAPTTTQAPNVSSVTALAATGSANASACSVSLIDVTTNITYTAHVSATGPLSGGLSSASGSLVNATFAPLATSAKSNYSASVFSAASGATPIYGMTGYGLSSLAIASSVAVSPVTATPSNMTASSTISSTLSRMYTNTTSFVGTSATPSACGEHGDFMLTWDDEPNFVPTNPITDPSDAPPVFNPYHHFYFSNGYIYMPPPTGPFKPVSAPRLVMFLSNETGPSDNTHAGAELSGEIGSGIHRSSNAFWFNAYSAYLGCDNKGPEACTMHVTGLTYQQGTNSEVPAFSQTVTIPPCIDFQNCRLQKFQFAKSMRGLSGIRIQAFVGNATRSWFMDDLSLGWTNNTCEAGLLRERSQ